MTQLNFFRQCAAYFLVLTLFAALTSAQQQAEQPAVTSQAITDNLYMITGQGGNLGLLVGDDAVVLVDDQMAPVYGAILDEIHALVGAEATDRIFLINTHFHADHTGGNELFGQSGSIIIAHENVRERLTVEQVVPFFNMRNPALQPQGLPVVTFSTDVGLHLNGEDIDVFYVDPAHTDGDAVVHFKNANVIHAGDLVFYGTYPFIDLDNGGTVDGYVDANRRVLEMCGEGTKIISGHGPLLDCEQMGAYVEMLSTTRDAVAALIAEDKSFEEVVDAKPTAAFDEAWSTFITAERYLSLLYRGLSQSSDSEN